jgi:hypothetical protein
VSDQYYFFGNPFLACLGYNPPHEHMDIVVEKKDQHKLNVASGIYLKDETVLNLLQGNEKLKNYVTDYLTQCKSGGTNNRCPR